MQKYILKVCSNFKGIIKRTCSFSAWLTCNVFYCLSISPMNLEVVMQVLRNCVSKLCFNNKTLYDPRISNKEVSCKLHENSTNLL